MLVKIPFPIEVSKRAKHEGTIYVDPEDVSAVNRAFERVHVMMKNGKQFASTAPKSTLAVHNGKLVVPTDPSMIQLDHMPDKELLDKWYEDTIAVINEATGGMVMKSLPALG